MLSEFRSDPSSTCRFGGDLRWGWPAYQRVVYRGMVKFVNVRDRVGVTTAYFDDMPFLPRAGERITLTENPDGLKFGYYRVLGVHFISSSKEEDEDAELVNIRIEIEPIPHGREQI